MTINEMTGGEAIARMIRAFEGGPMFGMGGFQLLPFYDAARRLGLKHYLINDGRAGVFAADAYAKVSGKVGLLEALNAGTPMVALIGDTHRDHSWKNMTQENRQMDILRPACKDIIRIESVQRIPELMRRAFRVATTGRPGRWLSMSRKMSATVPSVSAKRILQYCSARAACSVSTSSR
jgi:acetolactate synthase-1/2/3 large subunit